MKIILNIKKLNNEKGVAAVLVLAVILVLAALGTIALVASAANVSMGNKARIWSADYYSLDSQAELYVQQVDECLKSAELGAQEYIKNEYYTSADITTTISALGFDVPQDAGIQNFYNEYYAARWTTGGAIITSQDYVDDPLSFTGDGTLMPDAAMTEYQNDLKSFNNEMFNSVYTFLASRKLNRLVAETLGPPPYVPIVLKGGFATYGVPGITPWTQRFDDAPGVPADPGGWADAWADFQPHADEMGVYICVKKASVDNKKVQVELKIPIPEYETVLQKINLPFKGNPVWTNAISAQGGITVTNSATAAIYGDVYASGTADASGTGISVTTDCGISIYGNVYAAGDVHATGDRGKIHVFSKNTSSTSGVIYAAKNGVYTTDNTDESLGFDRSVVGYIANLADYTEESTTPSGIIPFVYRDGKNWGNVYCRNLAVEAVVNNASIDVDGNVWTSDDIQMDGSGSEITVGTPSAITGNYIGLQSQSTETDPNASSSVINNKPFESDGITSSSSITINGSFIVPGTAFYEFDKGPDGDTANPYYQSAESITARTASPSSIFEAYAYDPGAGGEYEVYERDGGEYQLYSWNSTTKLSKLLNYMGGAGSGIKTNIFHGDNVVSGFSQGAVFMQKDSISPVTPYANPLVTGATSIAAFGVNATAYSELTTSYQELSHSGEGVLMDIFQAKTLFLGTGNRTKKFDGYVNKPYNGPNAGLIYCSGDTAITIGDAAGVSTGIIYCTGNLELTGNGTFTGTIICEKNVTIEGNVTVSYNEGTILAKLKDFKQVRDFFAPGSMGIDHFAEDYSTTSGTKTLMKRYKIMKWLELQELQE